MAQFRYTAKNDRGDELSGVVEAADAVEAWNQLHAEGLVDVQLVPWEESDAPVRAPAALSSGESSELMQRLAHVANAGVPLEVGLRAAADEIPGTRLAHTLRWLADQIRQGRSLEDALAQGKTLVPSYVTGLIAAAARTGAWGETLLELVEHQSRLQVLRRRMMDTLAYPLLMLPLAAIVFALCAGVSIAFKSLITEFGMTLPHATLVLFWWQEVGWKWAGGFLVVLLGVAAVYRIAVGRARWQRLLATMPLLGTVWHWSAVAEWASLLSVLLRREIPLPEALRLAGHGLRNSNVGRLSLLLADGVARGRSLSQMLTTCRELPSTLIPLVEWGERTGALSESLHVGAELLVRRVRVRQLWLESVIPSVLFIAIGCLVVSTAGALFQPMVQLISFLSY